MFSNDPESTIIFIVNACIKCEVKMYSIPTRVKSIYFAAWHEKKKQTDFKIFFFYLKDFTQIYQIGVQQKGDISQMKIKYNIFGV